MLNTIKRILREVYPYRARIVIIAVTGILYSAAYARLVLILKDLSDSFQTGDQNKVAQVAYFAFGLAFTVAISRYFHIYLMNYTAEQVANNYRMRLQEKFMYLNLGFHNQYISGSGGLLSRVLNDIRVIQDGLRMLADIFREPLLAIYLLINLFTLNWKLTLSMLIFLPLILLFLRQISRSLRKYVISGQENLERITSVIKESLDGIRIIQSFNLEKFMQNKLKSQTQEYVEIRRRVHARIEIMGPVTELLATTLILGIFFYFSMEVARGATTVGAVLAYIASMMLINQPIKKFQESYVRIQETIVSAERVYDILDLKNEVPQSSTPKPFPIEWKTISYDHVSFKYGDQWVLRNINFKIHRGESIAFVGQSGSGKSTIVNLLERFYDPTEGQILIDDIPIQEIDLKDLRSNIGLVTQDVFLFSDTVKENIRAGNFLKDDTKIIPMSKSAHAHDFIEKLPQKYLTPVGERGSLLSGGEKQRISIARAFFKDSSILILDEATSALDSSSEVEVQKGLDSLAQGRTSLIIAHRISTIQNVNRIFVLSHGKIIEEGDHKSLLQNKNEYYKFYNLQNMA